MKRAKKRTTKKSTRKTSAKRKPAKRTAAKKPAAKKAAKKKKASSRKSNENMTLIEHSTGREYVMSVMSGSTGPKVIDVRRLYGDMGYFTYDPGYTSTGSCESAITYIDGEEGILQYRGYPIQDLAAKSDYMESCYLLLYGELPTKEEKSKFVHDITYHSMLHEQINNFYRGFRRDAHPMAIVCGVVGALSAFYHDSTDITNPHDRMVASYRMIAKMPTLAAWAYKFSVGQPFIYPRNDLDYASNFLNMMFATPCEEYKINPTIAKAMDLILMLHADHEQNASASTVRIAGSSGANPFACIAAGVASLWGPAHGGANEAVLNMLAEIGETKNIKKFISKVKDHKDPTRLMGFGHRVYKNYDPRARIMMKTCHDVLKEMGIENEPMLDIAMELERIALSEDYFIQRKLYPNVDFYSGIIFRAIGIPTSMFTVLFAVARTVGWIAQWNEMIEDPHQKIGRPRQLYTGEVDRKYTPLNKR